MAAVLLLLGGCERKEKPEDLVSFGSSLNDVNLVGTNAQTFKAVRTADGFKFQGAENKAVLLVFFATWCPPCKAEVPHLVSLQKKYPNDLAVIAVLTEQNKPSEEIAKFMADHKINYVVTNGEENMKMATAVGGVRGIPAMFLYDKNGRLTANYQGATPEGIIETDLKKALGQ